MSLLNVGARALQANQTVLNTIGHNIANVNTAGYSRQSVTLETVQGQFTGGGYIGQGVNVVTVQRTYSEFLTRQASMAQSVQSLDAARAEKLTQLQDIFPGGEDGLGASINNMLNAWADVASAPTDLTARTVVLARADELATRFRAASERVGEIQQGVQQELQDSVTAANALIEHVSIINSQIARAMGSGQSPNDLLDQRDQLVRDLNQYVQTTSVAADDGTLSLFVGNQAVVLGTSTAQLTISDDGAGGRQLSVKNGTQSVALDEFSLAGGSLTGLLRFHNKDLSEGLSMLGRMALAISESVNAQNQLGLTLDGTRGGNLFAPIVLGDAVAGQNNTSGAIMGLEVADVTKLKASSYTVSFSAPDTGSVTRNSDGKRLAFADLTELSTFMLGEGLRLTDGAYDFKMTGAESGSVTRQSDGMVFPFADRAALDTIALAEGRSVQGGNGDAFSFAFQGQADQDQFQINPLPSVAGQMKALTLSPSSLAAGSALNTAMGPGNTGSLRQVSLTALPGLADPPAPVTLTFDGAGKYTRSDDTVIPATQYDYVPGQPIYLDPANPATGWSLALQGTPRPGDTLTVKDAVGSGTYRTSSGNANALLGLRDLVAFDGATMSDGYSSLIAQIGVRTQSAQYAASMSGSIAASLESDRTAVSGVNLDEEAARLIQYQQAYQAASKVIQISQSIFDTLIQSMGR